MWIPLQLVRICCFKWLILTFSRGHPQSTYAQIFLFLIPFPYALLKKINDITKQCSWAFQLTPSHPLWVCVLCDWLPRDVLNAIIMSNGCNTFNCKLRSFSVVSEKMGWLFDRFLCVLCLKRCLVHEGILESIRNILRFHKPCWCFQLWSFAADENEVNFKKTN